MSLSPRVSVIVPVRDGARDLARLLDSIDCVTHPKDRLEVIVCDNGSTDDSAAIARTRGGRVLELPGLTIAELRNRGAQEAMGDLLAFVDSDCSVSAGWLEAALPHLARKEVVAAGCYPFAPEEATWVQSLWTLKERLRPACHETPWLPSMNLIIKREAFEAVGGYNIVLETCEDVDLCYRLREKGGRIIWDQAIRVVHYGEPATLRILFRKERWHGGSNLDGVFRHGLRWEEVPSLALPVLVLASYGIPLASLLTGPILPLVTSPLLAVPPTIAAAAAARDALRARRAAVFPGLAAIYLVYLNARALALISH